MDEISCWRPATSEKSSIGAACGRALLATMKSQQAVAIRFVGRRVSHSTCLFFASARRFALHIASRLSLRRNGFAVARSSSRIDAPHGPHPQFFDHRPHRPRQDRRWPTGSIQRCGGLSDREMEAQVLDSMDIERERGITIKAQTAALQYTARDGQIYNLNLIDTPGHVDFSYEVSRSLSACEGALLVVDASQGVEAQTVANCYTALDLGVEVVPVLNKMDLPQADPEQRQGRDRGRDRHRRRATRSRARAKTGEGIDDILEAVVAPHAGAARATRRRRCGRMIIDSWFDNYVGVVMLVRVVDGALEPRRPDPADGDRRGLRRRAARRVHAASRCRATRCRAGEVGFVIAGIKELQAAKVGDTVTLEKKLPNNAGAGDRAAARLQGNPAAGLRRPLPDRGERVRRAARRAGKAQAQRRVAALRAGGQPGAGLRLPLRLPRPAAHGDRAGAARARVRPGPDHHRADAWSTRSS